MVSTAANASQPAPFTGFVDPNAKNAITPPLRDQLAEARRDDMPALMGIHLGPTGRSVSKSYGDAFNQLTAVGRYHLSLFLTDYKGAHVFPGTTYGADDKNNPTPAETRYKKAMDWLTEEAPGFKGKTRVDVYREKGDKYADAIERAAKA